MTSFILAALAATLFVAAAYAVGGLIFAFLWNWLMPLLWHAAPHLSWLQGVAAAWVIGVLQSIFSRTTVVKE